MGVRDSLSKLRARLKPKSKERRHKPDGTGSGSDGEGAVQAGSLPRPVSDVEVGGRDGGGGGSNTHPLQVRSTDWLLQPDEPGSVSGGRGVEGGTDLDGGKAIRRHSHLYADAGVVPASGSGQGEGTNEEEGDEFHSRSSTPSTPRDRDSNGAWTWLSSSLPLIIPSDNVGSSIVPDSVLGVPHPGENIGLCATLNENKSDGVPPEPAALKSLRRARDTPNGLSSLRSVAGTLCSILECCGVCCLSHMFQFKILKVFPANRAGYTNHRTFGTTDQSAFRVTLCTHSSG